MARSIRPVPDDLLRQLADEVRVSRQEGACGPAAVDDAELAAYAAGALDEAERRRFEELLARSPELGETALVVRETLAEPQWRDRGAELAAKLRLPLAIGAEAPAVEPQAPARTFLRVRKWSAAAALAAAFLLGMGVGALVFFGNGVRDLFQVSTERLGGDVDATLDSGITDSAGGNVRKSLSDLKDLKDAERGSVSKSLSDTKP
ncbi:MAG: hypothetical protein FJ291_25255 [Planctomycetes bacterium]|nr:hypothetical protein [Planctomycetota bacterium]